MKIYQLEITNECNFSCEYCPRTPVAKKNQPGMKRKVQKLSYDRIKKMIDVMEPTDTIRLHHYGETLMEKSRAIEAIKLLRKSGKVDRIELNTNGSLLTPESAGELFKAGLSFITVSFHRSDSVTLLKDRLVGFKQYQDRIRVIKIVPENDQKKIDRAKSALKVLMDMGYQCDLKRMRDLGKVGTVDESTLKKVNCAFLTNNQYVLMSNGLVARCCEVYDNEPGNTALDGIVGSIKDPKIHEKTAQNIAFSKCKGCPGYNNTGGMNDSESIPIF